MSLKLYQRDPAAFVAYSAAMREASASSVAFSPELWPLLFDREIPRDEGVALVDLAHAALVDVYAPIVRGDHGVTPELLYRAAAERGVHRGDIDGFANQPLVIPAVLSVFIAALVEADKSFAPAA